MDSKALNDKLAEKIHRLTKIYGRIAKDEDNVLS